MSKHKIIDLLGRTVFRQPEAPRRTRDPSKPMQVLCGWDICFESPHYLQAWSRLANKKWYGASDGESNITRADFDAVLGHAVAVTDVPASAFAAELIAAYPEAKVVLNVRRDLDAWYRSAVQGLCVSVNESWLVWTVAWLTGRGFWTWMVIQRLLLSGQFRATDQSEGAVARAIRRNGKWVYREHCAMVRGLVPKDKLLEFDVRDGWEPLCKFLEKDVPDQPFPNVNGPAGFEKTMQAWMVENQRTVKRNLSVLAATLVGGAAIVGGVFALGGIQGLRKILCEG